jgi:two-component system OmpR family response regulator
MKRILVVEDNEDVAEVFAQLIDMLGYQSATAPDVEQGLRLTSSWKPQLVLCDLGLPGDGLEFARACKRDPELKDIKLIAVSGRNGAEDKKAALAAGFDDLLGKPVEFATLQAICELA